MPVYVTTRYADARGDGLPPARAFTAQEATEALEAATTVVSWIDSTLTIT